MGTSTSARHLPGKPGTGRKERMTLKTVACQAAQLCKGAVLALCLLFLLPASALAAESPQLLSSFGPDGSATANFGHAAGVAADQQSHAIYVVDRGAGTVGKFDETGQPLAFTGSAPYISGNEITGLSFLSGAGESQLAVDSQTHEIYVTSG